MSKMDRNEFVQSASVLAMGLTLLLHQQMPDMDREAFEKWIKAHLGQGDSTKLYALVAFATGRVSRSALEIALEDRELLEDVASLADTEEALEMLVDTAVLGFSIAPDLKHGAELLAGESYDKNHNGETEC